MPAARPHPLLRATGRALAVVLVASAAVAAGIGWLYLLRDVGGLNAGPRIKAALPLQRLAGGSAQPLGRLVVAWLPAGLAAGIGAGAVSQLGRPGRAAATALVGLVVLLALGALADAVTASEPIGDHLRSQPHRVAIWVAAGLMAAGAALAPAIGRGAGSHASWARR
ncbi:MAG: hypothetical protein QOH62_3295 [Solirubrobacteraceae bacterium]|nr:hypothetical protein [Solirubrobacteraceae bacterium]